jgi:hypothetical protein
MAKKRKQNKRVMLDIIKRVIKDKYIPANQTIMAETDTGGKQGRMSCSIECKDEEILLCSFDEKGNNANLFPYFCPEEGYLSMCDYILFAEDNEKLFVFLIDLKDTTVSAKKQVGIARTFASFITDRISEIEGSANFPKPIEFRKIGIKTTQMKMTTKEYEKLAYDQDKYLVLPDYHHFYVRRYMNL